MAAPVILIEAQPRHASDGQRVTVRLAGGGGKLPYFYNGLHWRAGVAGLPTIITALDFEGLDLGTGGVPQATELRWTPASRADLDELAGLYWLDAPITVRIGPEGKWPPVALAGTVLDAPAEPGVLMLKMADPATELKKPVPPARYGGTGGLDGPAEWDGQIKRRVWGRVWNLRADPIDKAHNIYALADPARPIQSIDAVRDKGAAAAALVTCAWAGSMAATLAALQAAVAPQGGGVICPSIACIKWWTQPAGDLCADVHGEIGTGYVETAAEIAARLVATLGTVPFADNAIASAAALRPAPVGWVVKDETTAVSAMLDELLGHVSLLWVLGTDGRIAIREWAWAASTRDVRSHQVSRRRVFRPVVTRKLRYRRNELPMQRGDLAAIVLAPDVAFLSGATVESLKPAEAAADVTSAVTGVAEVTINADHTGAVVDALPRSTPYTLARNGTDVTTAAAWSVAVISGVIDASIGAATGVLAINTSAGSLTSALLRITAVYGATTRSLDMRVTKVLAAPPPTGAGGGGSGGSTASGNVIGTTSSTSMVAIGDELTVTIGSAGTAELSANYAFFTGAPTGSYGEQAQWYWHNGSAWVALGSAVTAIQDDIPAFGDGGYGECNFTDSGRTAASSQRYQLFMRNDVGAVTRSIYGTCSVVGG